MENVVPTETIGAWESRLTEITSRQNVLTTRIGQIETRLSAIAQDQNNAADSNQALWRTVQQIQGGLRDMESDESDRERVSFTPESPREQG